MTPRLQQALKLLQVPTLELQQILKQEIMQNPLLEEVDELTDNEDLAKEDSPEEAANQESEDSTEEDETIDWSEYMQDGAFDRAYIPQSETGVEFLEKVPVTRTDAGREPARAAPLPEPAGRAHGWWPSSWSARSTTAAGWRRRSRTWPRRSGSRSRSARRCSS